MRRAPSDHDIELAARLADWGVPILVAITKGDKVGRSQRASRTHVILHALGLPSDQGVVTSAVTGEGVPDLRDSILALSTAARQTP